jgi:enamine deaminase RidA (YjgF/YER057c/UK114 family)
MRRVNALVSETFTDRRQPLPAISVVRVGGLPLVGAQVVLESTAMSRRAVNSHGVLFISGQMASGKSPLDPVMPLAVQSLDSLVKAVRLGGSKEAEVLSCTCFISGLEGFSKIRVEAAHRFPKASFNVVQLTREPSNALAECEAVARAGAPLAGGGRVFSPEGLPQSPNYSQIAAVAPGKLVLSGLQMGFGREETDTRLAFERLEKALEPVGGKLASTVFSRIYPVSGAAAERVRKVRFEFFRKETPPASTMLVFEGVPSLDATFGLDVITAGQ